jgi:hypothetical protein
VIDLPPGTSVTPDTVASTVVNSSGVGPSGMRSVNVKMAPCFMTGAHSSAAVMSPAGGVVVVVVGVVVALPPHAARLTRTRARIFMAPVIL